MQAAVRRGLELLGGAARFAGPGDNILLKPNMLSGDPPSRAVTTHPAVLQAVAAELRACGARLLFGDSPGLGSMESVARRNGLWQAAIDSGAAPADFHTAERVDHPGGRLLRQMVLARGAVEATGIVSLSKMKTHGLTRISGAVKNLFGCVPGLRKGEYHVKMPDSADFSRALADIAGCLRPRLHVMDGIVAMEGNGPRGGTPRPMRVLLFSTDPLALDAAFCRLIDLPPGCVPTLAAGAAAGLGVAELEAIEWLGDPPGSLTEPDFRVARTAPDRMAAKRKFPAFLKNRITPRPRIDVARCTGCGSCVAICPVRPRAMFWPDGQPRVSPSWHAARCIRCYCCQEICPQQAITLPVPLLGRIIHR